MTLTNTIVAKLAVAFVAIAMVFSLVAPAANAQTAEELQATIDALMAQIAELNSQMGMSSDSSSATVCPYTWTRSLSQGDTGADVMALQQFLNGSADTQVSASGAGAPGSETDYYGPATAAAVSNFQVKYRTDILSPVGLVNPTGYFGPSTMAKANMLCVASTDDSSDDSDDSTDDSDDSTDDDEDMTLSGEASLKDVSLAGADDDELQEGQEDAEIGEITVEFEDGDAEISRIDLALESTDTTEADPWDTFETISLWVDGDKIAEKDITDEDDYLDEDDGSVRFSGLDLIAMEDEEVEIVIAVTVMNSVDGTSDGNAWTVELDSMRFFDADDVATTDTTTGDLGDATGESFTVEEAGADDEIIVKTSSSDPDATTLQLEDDSDSDWYNVFTFDIDTDDSENDIEINSVKVSVELSSSTYNAIVDDVEIVINGTTIDDVTVTGGTSASADLVFDVDGDVVIDAGDRVEAELMMQFNSLNSGDEGMTIYAEVTSADADTIDAEGADDLSTSQISGAAQGETHTLRTKGIDVDIDSVEVDAEVTTVDGNTNDYAVYTISFDVTAFEQDVYISTNPATSIDYDMEDSSGSTTFDGTQTVTLTSTGDEVSNTFEITEGSTETITIEVTYVPGVANVAARLDLDTITFGETSGTPTGQTWTASPTETYRTAVKTIVN